MVIKLISALVLIILLTFGLKSFIFNSTFIVTQIVIFFCMNISPGNYIKKGLKEI